jgi:hypothetical protein
VPEGGQKHQEEDLAVNPGSSGRMPEMIGCWGIGGLVLMEDALAKEFGRIFCLWGFIDRTTSCNTANAHYHPNIRIDHPLRS